MRQENKEKTKSIILDFDMLLDYNSIVFIFTNLIFAALVNLAIF